MAASTNGDQAQILDLSAHPTAQKLYARCIEFFAEVQDLTPGKDLERRLNTDYGPGTPYYSDFRTYILQGLREGWVAETKLDASGRYRRGKIALPSPETRFFSITTVYMDSGSGDDDVFSGQHHGHPYGEINCVVRVDDDGNERAKLRGMQGWQGDGWTSPGPGTHHWPKVRGGKVVALFFLPAGRIAYGVDPGAPQPCCV